MPISPVSERSGAILQVTESQFGNRTLNCVYCLLPRAQSQVLFPQSEELAKFGRILHHQRADPANLVH
ncbi:MAG: hypothetical protein AAF891_10830, partial [Pseudomonadota bacterium]